MYNSLLKLEFCQKFEGSVCSSVFWNSVFLMQCLRSVRSGSPVDNFIFPFWKLLGYFSLSLVVLNICFSHFLFLSFSFFVQCSWLTFQSKDLCLSPLGFGGIIWKIKILFSLFSFFPLGLLQVRWINPIFLLSSFFLLKVILCSFCFYLFVLFFGHAACRILVLRPGVKPMPSALEVWSVNHGTTREVSHLHSFILYFLFFFILFVRRFSCFPASSGGKESACNAGGPGSTPGWGRSPGEGNGNPLQYS